MSWKAVVRACAILVVGEMCIAGRSARAQAPEGVSGPQNDFKFEVVSIKLNKNAPVGPGTGKADLPDGIHAVGVNTYQVLESAYLPEGFVEPNSVSISHAPDWVLSERYDIEARVADKDLKLWQSQTGIMAEHVYLRAALRSLLKERYKLQAHLVDTQVPYLSIAVDPNHNKLVAVSAIPLVPNDGADHVSSLPSGGHMTFSRDQDDNMTWRFLGCTMDDLTFFLKTDFQQLVWNKTGLNGRYNFQFTVNRRDFAEDEMSRIRALGGLGFRLQKDKGPGHDLVIDHIERPTAN